MPKYAKTNWGTFGSWTATVSPGRRPWASNEEATRPEISSTSA